ncbi:MAG: HlyD family type I secretion periplasmic adaptor subunit [Allosphingosinicella sp.]|uniref:HlyD family type I secretion periplasmic adaptor subunit n=1 Tax=Allosphingosinicella sp. TaxID=2823234 RepID=UPI00392F3AF9
MTDTHFEDRLTETIKPRLASSILLWAVAAFFVIFIIWAAVTELDRTVRAQGRVIPSSQLQVVSNLEGGIVSEIMVQPGQEVERDAELIRLDPTQSGADLGSGQASVGALNAKIARLQAEIAGREPQYPPAIDASTAEQIQIERSLHISRMAELSGLLGAAQARISQAERAVAEAEAAYQARVSARDARAAEVNLLRPLVERGIEPRLSLMQAESAAAVTASEAAASAQSIARARASVAEARASLNQLRQDWRARAAGELAAAQAELAARRSSLPALADRVERTVVRAPMAGRINRVLVTTVGGTVRPGEPIVEIVPSEESLLVEALVTPQDIAFVRMGQPARVGLTAYDQSVYGTMDGEVVNISPDAVLNERTGESFYTVRVRTTTQLRSPAGNALAMGPGMVADVSLLGDRRTILNYILTPITRLSDTALRER